MTYYVEFSNDEMELLLESVYVLKRDYEEKSFYGSTYDFRDKFEAYQDLAAFLFHSLIIADDVEANSPGSRKLISKPNFGSVNQRSAGDEIPFDHPSFVECEVLNG